MNDLTEIRTKNFDLIIIANLDQNNEVPYNWEDVRNIASTGKPILLIHPGKHLKWLYPDKIQSIYERKGRISHIIIPEHPVFNHILPEETAWWNSEKSEMPYSCRRSYRYSIKQKKSILPLAYYLRPHVYLSDPEKELPEMSGYPLIEIREGKGKIIASELLLNNGVYDPIPGQIFYNIIDYLIHCEDNINL